MAYNGFLNKRMNDMGLSIKNLAERFGCDIDRMKAELTTPSFQYKKRLMKALNISETEWGFVVGRADKEKRMRALPDFELVGHFALMATKVVYEVNDNRYGQTDETMCEWECARNELIRRLKK